MPNQKRYRLRNIIRVTSAVAILLVIAEGVRVFALTNQHTVITGKIFRTAQLSPSELSQLIEKRNIRTLINLRGTCRDDEWYRGEARVTHQAGISQEDISLSAKRLPVPGEIRRLIDVLDHAEYPVAIHCQRGADRTGLAATIALLLQTDATLSQARYQLLPRYGHISGGRTVVMDQFFDYYEVWLQDHALAHTPNRFRQWACNEYCPGPFRADLTLADTLPSPHAGEGFTITIRARNISIESWRFTHNCAGGIQLRYRLYTVDGEKLYTGHAGLFQACVKPGESIDLVAGLPPIAKPGRYLLHADLLDSQPIDLLNADFVQYGSEPLVLNLFVQ